MAKSRFFRGDAPVADHCGTVPIPHFGGGMGPYGEKREDKDYTPPPGPCDPAVLAQLLAKAGGRCDDPAYLAHTQAYGCSRCPHPLDTCYKGQCVPRDLAWHWQSQQPELKPGGPQSSGLPWPNR
jgi:hypothetical protein